MAHTHTRNLLHLVFATKDRTATITPTMQPKLEGYMVGILQNLGVHLLRLNSVADHCHLLVDLPARLALSDVVNKLKANATRHINEEFPRQKFAWQRGYGAFSVSQSHANMVIEYIANQQEHHRRVPLAEELARLLEVYGFAGDPEFIDG
ncbi:MAG: IS200/IS605 family transposase [Planctomycetes bacterium]|nr:IS200/IS605 family transposase [Planctomycetota bacterium]